MSTEREEPGGPSAPEGRKPYQTPTLEFVQLFGEQVLFVTCKAGATGSAPTTGGSGCFASSCTADGDS